MNKEIKKYIKDIELMFPIMQKEEKEYIKRIEQSIMKQCDNQQIAYQDLVNQYGTPTDIMTAYVNDIDTEEFVFKTRKHRKNRKIIIGTCFCVVLCTLIVSLWRIYQINQEREDFMNHVPVEYIEEIEVIE